MIIKLKVKYSKILESIILVLYFLELSSYKFIITSCFIKNVFFVNIIFIISAVYHIKNHRNKFNSKKQY